MSIHSWNLRASSVAQKRNATLTILSTLSIAFALSAFGCGTDASGESGTAGKIVSFATRGRGDPTARTFLSGQGWTITLTQAAVAVGGFYFFDGDPAFVHRFPAKQPRERLASLLGVGIAYAHPGHYVAGNAMGEMSVPTSLDLLADTTDLPAGKGFTGRWNSGRWSMPTGAPSGSAAAVLGSHIAFASGSAAKDGTTVYFTVTSDFANISENSSNGQIDGCVLEGGTVTGDGVITATVDMKVWFNLADFTGISEGSADAPTVLAAVDQPYKAFSLGVEQLSAYRFSYEPK